MPTGGRGGGGGFTHKNEGGVRRTLQGLKSSFGSSTGVHPQKVHRGSFYTVMSQKKMTGD